MGCALGLEHAEYLMLLPQLAGISLKDLGAEVGSVAKNRKDIVGAIDFLATGI